MKAVVIERYGGNEVVEVRDMPRPNPGRHEILLKVHAASVNPVDWKIRSGQLKIVAGLAFPHILGSECAGEVVETGVDVQRFSRGDQVVAFPGIKTLGAYAEYVCVNEKHAWFKPEGIGYESAATIPIAGLTALQSLRDLGHVGRGDRVLVNGAAGGVGTFAVQIARLLGASVTAVCSAANAGLVKDLGAVRVIDYHRENFTAGGNLYEVVFDAVAKRSFGACKKILSRRGVYIATLPQPGTLLNQYLTGFLTRKKARTIVVHPNSADMNWMRGQIEAGRMHVVIDRAYPLEHARDAFAHSETGKARGKIVLNMADK